MKLRHLSVLFFLLFPACTARPVKHLGKGISIQIENSSEIPHASLVLDVNCGSEDPESVILKTYALTDLHGHPIHFEPAIRAKTFTAPNRRVFTFGFFLSREALKEGFKFQAMVGADHFQDSLMETVYPPAPAVSENRH